jgi:hypothetical protein
VKAGISKIQILGDNDFKREVLLDLGWLMTSGPGQDLVNSITARSFTLTIKKGDNGTGYNPDADSWERVDDGTPSTSGTGTMSKTIPGPGANTTISYDPHNDRTVPPPPDKPDEAWMTRPPAIGLAHEMVHAWSGIYGMRAKGYDASGWMPRKESQAIGLGEWERAAFTENRFRAAFGMPLRKSWF